MPARVPPGRDLRSLESVSGTASAPGRATTVAALAGIIGFALLLRLALFQGFHGGDDGTYIFNAHLLARGHFVPHSNQWDVRIGLIAPLALAIFLFDPHTWSVALYPLLLSLLSLPLIYALGTLLWRRDIGLLAALLLACFPQDIYYATTPYPDLTGAFYGALAVLLALLSKAAAGAGRRNTLAALCALALVGSYLTRETNLVFVPICLLATWQNGVGDNGRRTVIILAIVVAALAVESLVYRQVTGDPLFRLQAIRHHTGGLHAVSPLQYLLRWPAVLFNPGYPQTFLYALLSLWSILALRRRAARPQERFLLIWLLGSLALFALAIISLHPLTPLLEVEPRYLSVVAYPAILLIAQALWQTYARGTARDSRAAVTQGGQRA